MIADTQLPVFRLANAINIDCADCGE